MKMFWKLLGAAALIAGVTPYKVEKNEDSGENSYQALLYRLTIGPGSGDDKKKIDVDLGLNLPKKEEKEETHLFSDELCVEYTGVPVEEAEAPAEPEEPAEPAESEAAAEEPAEAPAEAPEEEKEEA